MVLSVFPQFNIVNISADVNAAAAEWLGLGVALTTGAQRITKLPVRLRRVLPRNATSSACLGLPDLSGIATEVIEWTFVSYDHHTFSLRKLLHSWLASLPRSLTMVDLSQKPL